MLIEATLLGLGVLVWKKLGQGHEWTPEHEEMYVSALEHLKGEAGVAKLREIADKCASQGHHVKAYALRKRADLRATPAKVKAERKAVYERAMASKNIEAMLKVAAAFESITATQAAANIRARVEELQHQTDALIPDAPAAEPAAQARVAEPVAAPEASTEVPAQEQAAAAPEPKQEPTRTRARAERPRAAKAQAPVIDVASEPATDAAHMNGAAEHAEPPAKEQGSAEATA
jgi:hypothetical protein